MKCRLGLLVVLPQLLAFPRSVHAQGTPMGGEFLVNTHQFSQQNGAHVASSSGSFVVVWSSYHVPFAGRLTEVFAQRYSGSGAPLGAEFLINTYTSSQQFAGGVAADSSGNFVVVWESLGQDGSGYGIFGQRWASSGAQLGAEFRINTSTTFDQARAAVASDPSGNFVVVWDTLGNTVFGQRYASSGTPLGAEFQVNTFTTDSFQTYAAVSSDSSGNFVVVWQTNSIGSGQDGSAVGVFGQRYASSGAPLGSEFQVNTYTYSNQDRAAVASDASGNFVVVWESTGQDGSNKGVFGQRHASTGARIGLEFQVNTYTTGNQYLATVTSDSSGNFVVAWTSNAQDGANTGIFGQRYASSGAPLGSEFKVNSYTTSYQQSPSASCDSSGNFVVVWQSYGQDLEQFGVFGQRYGKILPVELTRFSAE